MSLPVFAISIFQHRFAPIITLTILNILIIIRFNRIARKREVLKGHRGSAATTASMQPSPHPASASLAGGGGCGGGQSVTIRTDATSNGFTVTTSAHDTATHYRRHYFCARHFFVQKKEKMFTFSRAHSRALTNATRQDITNISQDWADFCQCQEFWTFGVISWALFWRKNASLLTLERCPQPLEKPSHRAIFPKKWMH